MRIALLLPVTLLLAGCTAPAEGPADVRVADVKFEPLNFTAVAGKPVLFRNVGGLAHTVTSDEPGGPMDSGNMAPGATYTVTFPEPGVYPYHCKPHASRDGSGQYLGMVGTITVVGNATS